MRDGDRDTVLNLLAEMKRAAKNPARQSELDQLAIGVLTIDTRPQVMVSGLHKWLGLSQPLGEIIDGG